MKALKQRHANGGQQWLSASAIMFMELGMYLLSNTCQLCHPFLLTGIQLQLHQDVCEGVNIHPYSEDVNFMLVA